MSVTQYIGARYVPLFADPLAWDITKSYEALTIVYHQGNSYTSRQAVPAGIDITNDAYWALTGNYNAQIEQYRAEVQTYDDRITANTSSNTSQDAQLAGTASSGLKTLIDANTASNTAQDAQLAGTASSGLKTLIQDTAAPTGVLVIADSYGTDYKPGGGSISNTCLDLFEAWAENYHLECNVIAQGGYGFGVSSKPYSDLLTSLVNGLTTDQKANVGCVIFLGGYNDCSSSQAAITSGMDTCRTIIKNNLPKCSRVLLLPVGMAVEGLTSGSHAGFTYAQAANMFGRWIQASGESGLGTVVPDSNMVMRKNVLFSNDYVHPNEDGHVSIFRFMKDAFAAGGSENPRRDILQYNIATAVDSAFASGEVSFTLRGQSPAVLSVGSSTLTLASPIASQTLSPNTSILLGTVIDAFLQPFASFRMPCLVNMRYDTNHYHTSPGWLEVANGEVRLRVVDTNESSTNYLALANVAIIYIYPLAPVVIDTLFLK